MCKKFLLVIFFFSAACLRYPGGADSAAPVKMRLEPNVVHIGATFNGVRIMVTGEIPADAEALVRVTGSDDDIFLKKKERALGLFWMNLGNVTFQNAPGVYLLYAPRALAASSPSSPEEWKGLGVGFEALERRVQILPNNEDKRALFQELVKLKQSEGLYGMREGAIRYGDPKSTVKTFQGTLRIPARMSPGAYQVDLFALRNGAVLSRATETLKVSEVGFPAMLSSLAFSHGALYGVLASVVAIIAGLLVGVLFKGGKGAH